MVANPGDKFWDLTGGSGEEPKFFYSCGPLEVAERTWFVSIMGGVTAFETDEGLVMVDAGMRNFAPQMAKELRKHTSAPVHTVIYTHGHVDHAFGLADFLVEGHSPSRESLGTGPCRPASHAMTAPQAFSGPSTPASSAVRSASRFPLT